MYPQNNETEEQEKTAMIGDNTRNDYEPEIQEIEQQRTKKKD